MNGFEYLLENIESIIDIDDLNDAMFKLQGFFGISEGDVCGIYWAEFNGTENSWELSNSKERVQHIENYLHLEIKLNFQAELNNRTYNKRW